jgi:hypothetical protein
VTLRPTSRQDLGWTGELGEWEDVLTAGRRVQANRQTGLKSQLQLAP